MTDSFTILIIINYIFSEMGIAYLDIKCKYNVPNSRDQYSIQVLLLVLHCQTFARIFKIITIRN